MEEYNKIKQMKNLKEEVQQMATRRIQSIKSRQDTMVENIEKINKQVDDLAKLYNENIPSEINNLKENVQKMDKRLSVLEEKLRKISPEKVNEKLSKMDELEKHIKNFSDQKKEINENIQHLKNIEKTLAKKLNKEEGDFTLLEKFIHILKDNKGKKRLINKNKIKRIEKSKEDPTQIAEILKSYLTSVYDISSGATFSELLKKIKTNNSLPKEVKKQLVKFYTKVIKSEYAGHSVKFSSNLKDWAEEIIKVIDEELDIERSNKTKTKKKKDKKKDE